MQALRVSPLTNKLSNSTRLCNTSPGPFLHVTESRRTCRAPALLTPPPPSRPPRRRVLPPPSLLAPPLLLPLPPPPQAPLGPQSSGAPVLFRVEHTVVYSDMSRVAQCDQSCLLLSLSTCALRPAARPWHMLTVVSPRFYTCHSYTTDLGHPHIGGLLKSTCSIQHLCMNRLHATLQPPFQRIEDIKNMRDADFLR